MQIAVYCAVLVIALGSVLLELDWMSAPMTPMVDTEAGLHAAAMPPPAPATQPVPNATAPSANIGAPIVPPGLAAPAQPAAPSANAGTPAAAAPDKVEREPRPQCNVDACTAAYRSFRPDDCTYQPTNGPRRLCTK
jgi:hypothetical protein